MTDLSIRAALRSDIPILLEMIHELAVTEDFPFPVTVTEAALADSLFGANPAAEALLAFSAGRLAGFVVFYQTFATTTGRRGLHLDDLFVRSEFQGRGYGRVLLSHLAQIARDRGCARFEWWALRTNANAIRFFQHVGARPMDELVIFRTTGDKLESLAQGQG